MIHGDDSVRVRAAPRVAMTAAVVAAALLLLLGGRAAGQGPAAGIPAPRFEAVELQPDRFTLTGTGAERLTPEAIFENAGASEQTPLRLFVLEDGEWSTWQSHGPTFLNTPERELAPGTPIWLRNDGAEPRAFTRRPFREARDVPLRAGLNSIEWSGPPTAASALLNQSPGLSAVQVFDPVQGRYRTYDPRLPEALRDDFTIRPGQVTFVTAGGPGVLRVGPPEGPLTGPPLLAGCSRIASSPPGNLTTVTPLQLDPGDEQLCRVTSWAEWFGAQLLPPGAVFADSAGGSLGGDGSLDDPFLTLEQAVTAAQAAGGGTVYLETAGTPGTWRCAGMSGSTFWGCAQRRRC